ncbi:O-antigen ligase family protein, partial [Fibrobacterales bacterium]|nr:O-antigen ligase family protein [Fibrobacterales bacterium]
KKVEVKETTEVAGDDLSNKRRIELPRAGLIMYAANPVFGVGPGNYKDNSAKYNPILWDLNGPGVAHNTYLEIMAETGTIGFLLFLGILIGLIRGFNKVMNSHSGNLILFSQSLALKISLYGYSFAAIFLSAQFSKFYWLIVFVGIGIQRVAKMEEHRQTQKL